MRRFFAPRDSKMLVWMTRMLVPVLVRIRHGRLDMSMSQQAMERFKSLSGKRTIICPNHPSREDADAMFGLSALVGESFNFMTAQQLFHGPTWSDLWLQYMGCYSVFRDSPDFSAYKTTRHLLVQGRKKIVIFPEGEISHQNDTLLPLKTGAVQMGFAALSALKLKGREDPVFIEPLAMKYVYSKDITRKISQALERLEKQLDMPRKRSGGLYERLLGIADKVLGTLEATYNCASPQAATLGKRIGCLRAEILAKVASYLEVELSPSDSQLQQAHALQNILYELRFCRQPSESLYERRQRRQRSRQLRSFYHDLKRVINFIAVFDGYLEDPSTQERIAEVVGLLETEVFGRAFVLGPRQILFDAGCPINLNDHFEEYLADRSKACARVNALIKDELGDMLSNFDRQRSPVYVSMPSAPCHPFG